MRRGSEHTRRFFLRSWILSLLGKRSAAATSIGFDPIDLTLRGFAPARAFHRHYRLDATILLLGAPIFTRRAAGGGYASVEISTREGARATALQFAAGSDPARAHGLNRFGILREALVERGDLNEVSFAGLMTRSREASLDQGRKALASSARNLEGVVARGRSFGTTVQSWIESIDLAPDCNWSNVSATLSDALRRDPQTPPRTCSPNSAITFLQAMRGAAMDREAMARRMFMHAGKFYWLETRRRSESASELAGTIHDMTGARCAEFYTTYAPGDESGIPIRIDYRPRSFLRLTFEAEREATQPTIPSVFHEESA